MKTVDLLYPPGLTFWQALQKGMVPQVKCPAYLQFVSTLPCCISGMRSVTVHHIVGHGQEGQGTKASDFLTIPLGPEFHLPQFPEGIHAIGYREWEKRYGDQMVFVAQTLLEAVYRGVLKI